MSAEFLANLSKNTKTSSSNSQKSIKPTNIAEKEEGSSLFDSLLNGVKKDSLKKEEKNLEKTNKKTDTKELKTDKLDKNSVDKSKPKTITTEVEQKINSLLSEKTKSQEIEEIKPTKITKKSNPLIESKNSLLLKKMVEKLVNAVVNAAKEIFDKKSDSKINTEELTKTIEKLVENKIGTITDKKNLEILLNKKLDIIKNSVDIIKKEIKVIPKDRISTQENIKAETSMINKIVKDIKDNISTIDGGQEETTKAKKIIESKENNKKDLKNIEVKKSVESEDKNIQNKEDVVEKLSTLQANVNELEKLVSINDNKNSSSKFDSKKDLKTVEVQVDNRVKIIKEVISNIKEKISEVIVVKTTENEIKKEMDVNLSTVSSDKNISDKDAQNGKKPLLATMFLNAQKIAKNKTSLEQLKDAKNNILEKKTVESVKVSADKLDLKLEETIVKHEEQKGIKPVSEEKTQELKTNSLINNKLLNKVFINQKELSSIKEKIDLNKSIEEREEKSVEIIVPRDVVQSLQHKIIGAQQKMGMFMNDVARNMYLNYKPPITAFRVNLNPANLGSISIMMRANKLDNSLSVSMNLSNSNTMEAFTENRLTLQSAIQRQFSESSNVSINFGMQDQEAQSQFNQNNQKHNQENKQNSNSNKKSESELNEEQEIIATNDYM
ncbi:MAG: hypothetical protein CSA86_03200 [Arcobacter sp.]|nr:MAG: hypothetical protein CSA86_03200 [Arcobacter sp.]